MDGRKTETIVNAKEKDINDEKRKKVSKKERKKERRG